MAKMKRLAAGIGCRNGMAVKLTEGHPSTEQPFLSYALECNDTGADALLVLDLAESDQEHEKNIGQIKEAGRLLDIPIVVGGYIKRLEDIKKYLYAGARSVFLHAGDPVHVGLLKEAADRFGREKIHMLITGSEQLKRVPEFYELGASRMILDLDAARIRRTGCMEPWDIPFLTVCTDNSLELISDAMSCGQSDGVVLIASPEREGHYMEIKQQLETMGNEMDLLRSQIPWSAFKLNSDGLMPVVVQDYRTMEVLMMAYMNEQAFADTLLTGKMHYYSRSRKCQWLKGETSGHFQYVRSLRLDCDNDTILAKVHQIGPACHTGAVSCFYQPLAEKESREMNPLKVFESVFQVILDRKEHPKEGSYTNYLFEKGIDKILKKVGEEATEIVIAAKNPDPEEIKYEISDLLYHLMVLLAEKGVSWEDITEELAKR